MVGLIYVDRAKCTGCGHCLDLCPTGALSLDAEGIAQVDEELCDGCEACVEICDQGALLPWVVAEEARPLPATPETAPVEREPESALATRGRAGSWLASALNLLVYEIGPAVERILRQQKQGHAPRAPQDARRGGPREARGGRRRRRRKREEPRPSRGRGKGQGRSGTRRRR